MHILTSWSTKTRKGNEMESFPPLILYTDVIVQQEF